MIGLPVCASDGLQITPDADLHNAPALHAVIVCGGVDIQHSVTREHLHWLQGQARHGRQLGAVCTGTYALAKAGVLNGYHCAIHWENLNSIREQFPKTIFSTELFVIDRDRFTCSGGTAPLDLMCNLIRFKGGKSLASDVSEQFIVDRIRDLITGH